MSSVNNYNIDLQTLTNIHNNNEEDVSCVRYIIKPFTVTHMTPNAWHVLVLHPIAFEFCAIVGVNV